MIDTQPNQEEQEVKTLEDLLENAGQLFHLRGMVDKSRKPSELTSLNEQITRILTKDTPGDYLPTLNQVSANAPWASRYATAGLSTRLETAKPLYEKYGSRLKEQIIEAMQQELKESQSKADAALRLSTYFTGLAESPELDQVTADEYAQDELAKRIGVDVNFTARGHIEAYRKKHENLYARLFAEQFIKETKSEKGSKYELDTQKIDEVMKEVKAGSVIYTNHKQIQEQKEAEAAKTK